MIKVYSVPKSISKSSYLGGSWSLVIVRGIIILCDTENFTNVAEFNMGSILKCTAHDPAVYYSSTGTDTRCSYIHTGKSTRQADIPFFHFPPFFHFFLPFSLLSSSLTGNPLLFFIGFFFFFALFCPVAKPRTYHMLYWPSAGQCPRVRECDGTITMANRKYCAGLGTTIFAITVLTAPASEYGKQGFCRFMKNFSSCFLVATRVGMRDVRYTAAVHFIK